MSYLLGNIVRGYCLRKMQVVCQYAKKVELGNNLFVSKMILYSVKHFGRWLWIIFLNWQTRVISNQ
jgi:hypothetical protein